MLEKEPRYRFILDGQTCLLEDWGEQLEMRGQDPAPWREKIAQYVRARRVFIGPYYLQPDWQLVSEEALVRNLLLGRQISRELGGMMQAGWLLDNFGQISQAPQIHREFNLAGLFVWRGVEMPPTAIRSEFEWVSPDGSSVMAVYLVGSYRNGMRLAEYRDCMRGRIQREVAKLQPFATTPNVLLMNGYDQEIEPDDILPSLASGELNFDHQAIQSTPEEYLVAIARANSPMPKITGALYSGRYIAVFPGVLSSRMYLKTRNDVCQRELERGAEPLAALLWGLGEDYPTARLQQAWKLLLKNHPHDSICGVSIDDVHTDMETRFVESSTVAQGVLDDALYVLAANIDTSRYPDARRRWIVVNPALQKRDGVIPLPNDLPENIVIKDDAGRGLPTQRVANATIVQVSDIPGLGYKTLFAIPPASATTHPQPLLKGRGDLRVDSDTRAIENELLRVLVNQDGTITLTDKRTQTTYPIMAILEDGGDAGDTYNYSDPETDQIISSLGCSAEIQFVEIGPLRARVRISATLEIPVALTSDGKRRSEETRPLPVVTWLTIGAHSPLVQFHTEICNTARDHRVRVLFPTCLRSKYSFAETQFDVVARPITPEPYDDSTIPDHVRQVIIGAREPRPITIFAQRRFVDVSDGARGIAILSRGLTEYEVLPGQNTIALTLFRGVGWIAKTDLRTRIGDAGPMIAVPDAQCLRTMAFDYALLAHPGDWQTGGVVVQADEFNSDLFVVETDAHVGVFPDAAGWLELETDDTLPITAFKQSEDGQAIIVRFFNPSEAHASGSIRSLFDIKRAQYVTLGEETKEEIPISNPHCVSVAAMPKQIVTIRLEIERPATPLPSPRANVRRLAVDHIAPSDFRAYETGMDFLPAEVAREENRAADLEKMWTEKRAALAKTGNTLNPLEASQRQLDVETYGRAALEARLSATLLQKKLMSLDPEDATAPQRIRQIESTIREIGAALNQTRVRKRAYEYIVDYYSDAARHS